VNKKFRCMTLVFLIFYVFSVILTGCSDGEDSNKSQGESYEGELPPVTLTWHMFMSESEDQRKVFEKVNEYLKEKINVELKIINNGFGVYEQRVSAAITGNDKFDLFFACDWIPQLQYNMMASRGYLADLTELLPEYAPQTWEMIDEKFWDILKINGKIYSVPNYQVFTRQRGVWVRKDLADKYGFNENSFKTYKDLEPFLKAIAENEPGIDPINPGGGYIGHFMDEYGPNKPKGNFRELPLGFFIMESEPDKIYNTMDFEAEDYIVPSLEVARDWYLKGYIRNDAITVSNWDAEIRAGKVASGITQISPDSASKLKDRYGFDTYFFPIQTPVLDAVLATLTTIRSNSPNKERAVMLIELLMTDKYLYNLLAYGIENEHYRKIGEDRIERVEGSKFRHAFQWAVGNTTLGYKLPGQPDDLLEQVNEINQNSMPLFLADFNFNEDAVRSESAIINAGWEEYGRALLIGMIDVEEGLAEYRKEIMDSVNAVRKEMYRQYEEYKKQKGK